jgi:two-component system sensor histidine kinase YesM
MLSGIMIYTRVQAVMEETIDANLDATSDLIRRIVQVSIDNNRGQVRKDLIVAEHFIGNQIEMDHSIVVTLPYRNSITEETGHIEVPMLSLGGEEVTPGSALVDRIGWETEGSVSIYQATPLGLLCVASHQEKPGGYDRIGELIPNDAPYDILVRREGTYFGRDYFNREWHLTAFKQIILDGELVAVLYVAQEQMDLEELRNDILSIQVGNSGHAYIMDTLSIMVVHPTMEGEGLSHYAHIQDLIFQKNGKIKYQEVDRVTQRQVEKISYFKFIPEMNWIVVVGSSMDDFFSGLYAIRLSMIIIFSAMMGLTFLLSVVIGRHIAEPILLVAHRLKDIAEGEADLPSHLDVVSNDEVQELALNFNRYLDKLRALKEMEKRELSVALVDARMSALQAQINPHFLYNTLETVRFMIALGDDRAETMVQLLADLFRVSIGKGEHYVSVDQELRHISLYIDIQTIRFPRKFKVLIDVDEDVLQLMTVKFLLQPLVENAILHGFEERETGGIIVVAGQVVDDSVHLRVKDNGSGLPADKLQLIRSQLDELAPVRSIGLLNVHKRLRLHFGEAYGLMIDSMPGLGTTVHVNFPVLRFFDEHKTVDKITKNTH